MVTLPRLLPLHLLLLFSQVPYSASTLTLDEYANTALIPPALSTSQIPSLANVTFTSLSNEITGTLSLSPLLPTTPIRFTCFHTGVSFLYVWLGDRMVCQFGAYNNSANGRFDGDAFILKRPMTVRIHAYLSNTSAPQGTLSLQWCDPGASSSSSSSSPPCIPQALPPSALSPTLPPVEVTRRAFQASALARWGSWLHRDILSIALLPDSAVLALQLCHLLTGVCQAGVQIDGNGGLNTPRVRVGAHALDHSYSQTYVAFLGVNVSVEYSGSGSRGLDVLITPQSQATLNASEYIVVLAGSFAWGRQGLWENTTTGLAFCGLGLPPSTHAVTLTASHPPWNGGGGAAVVPGIFPPGIPGGLPCENTRDCASGVCNIGSGGSGGVCAPASPLIHFPLPLDQGPVGVTTNATTTTTTTTLLDTITQRVGEAKVREYARYSEVYGEELAGVVEACTSALGWRHVFVPCEVGGVMPVTYGFSWVSPQPTTNDFAYVLFDWDGYFASFTAAVASGGSVEGGAREASYMNVIQLTKSATSAGGFVPNWAAGGSKAQQSEPALGSWAILQLFSTWGDTWLVELVYPELLDWHQWQWGERRVVMDPGASTCPACAREPGFITIGNDYYPCPGPPWEGCVGNYRGESGLDQSPLWDCPGADPTGNGGNCTGMAAQGSHLLTVGEVQSSSLFILDARALASLGRVLNRSAEEVGEIEARADAMQAQLSTLYNPHFKAFLNVNGLTGAPFPRLSPTMFYPLLTGAATPQQALDMVVTHLLNASTFCIVGSTAATAAAAAAAAASSAQGCYWGLPSIAASDPAFMQPQGYVYWRGLTWGPMALLTYLSLAPFRGYDPLVEAGVKGLVAQKRGQFMDMWERNRHVCENYSPFAPNSTLSPGTGWDGLPKSNGECTGWEFYTWGALNGVVALLEEKQGGGGGMRNKGAG